MKPKSLIPLVIVLAILAGLVVLKKQQTPHSTIVEQAGLIKLLPEGLSKSEVAKLELYAGAFADQKVVLAFDATANKWRVTSHFNAPVKQEVIDKYLDAALNMEGEPREKNVSDADLEQYELTEAKAFHVIGYKKDAKDPLFHMLVGKAPDRGSVFIRKADGKDVFVESKDLREEAGIREASPPMMMPGMPEPPKDNTPKKPEPGIWLNKEVAKIEVDKATKLALTTPDKALTFERREKPKVPEAAKPAEGDKPADANKTEADKAKPAETNKAPEFEWVATSGADGLTMKPNSVTALLGKLAPIVADDIVDPAKKAEYGLETPAFTCVVTFDGLPEFRLEAGRPNATGDGYLRVAGAKEEVIYSLKKATFDQLFAHGGDLFELPGLGCDAKTLTSVELTQPGGKYVLTKEAAAPEAPKPEEGRAPRAPSQDKWKLLDPVPGMKVQEYALNNVASALASWKPVDFAGASAAQGEPTHTATLLAGPQTYTLKVFGDAKTTDGVYVRVGENPAVFVMSRSDVNRIFIAAKDVYDQNVVGLEEEDIHAISFAGPKENFSVTYESDEAWKLEANGATSEAKVAQCTTLAADLASIRAEDFLFTQKELTEPVETTVKLKTKEGAEHTLQFTAEKDGKRFLKVSGKEFVCVVKADTLTGCFPTADSLKNAPAPEAKAPDAAPAAAANPLVLPAPTAAPAPAAPAPQPSVTPAMPTPPAPATVKTTPTAPAAKEEKK